MQIHELPTTAPVSDSDYIAFDTGSVNYKANFADFDASDNNITFTSDDEHSPTTYKTVSTLASNSLAVIIKRVSGMMSNVRYIYKLIGTTSMGTTALTLTGAIKELRAMIGDAAMGTSSTTLTGAIRELRDSMGAVRRAENASDVTIATSTGTELATITLTSGTYVMIGKCRFTANASGVRRLNFSTTSGATSWDVSYPSAVSAMLDLQVARIININTDTTFYLNAWQNSGSSLTCAAGYGTIETIKIS